MLPLPTSIRIDEDIQWVIAMIKTEARSLHRTLHIDMPAAEFSTERRNPHHPARRELA
jgi:hypothetical protein